MDDTEREIRKKYGEFVAKLEKDIPEIKKHIRDDNVKIRLIDRVKKIKDEISMEEDYEKNVEKLIYYTNTIINSIESISPDAEAIGKKVIVIAQFQKLGNSNNKVAVRYYNEILRSLDDILLQREQIVKERDASNEILIKIDSLKHLVPIDLESIKTFCNKFSIPDSDIIEIILYLIKENARIPAPVRKKPIERVETIEVVEENIGMSEEELQQANNEVEELNKLFEEEIHRANKELFDKYYEKSKRIGNLEKARINPSIETYEDFTETVIEYSKNEVLTMWGITVYEKIQNMKNEIRERFNEIKKHLSVEGKKDKETYDDYKSMIEMDINEYKELIEELKKTDSMIKEDTLSEDEEQLAFFAHSTSKNFTEDDLIDEDIKVKDKDKLLERINKVIAAGDKTENNGITPIKGLDDYSLGKKVYAMISNGQHFKTVNIAFVRVNKINDKPRIFIITATNSVNSVEELCEKCKKIFNNKPLREQIIDEINKIDSEDANEMGIQKEIYDSIFGDSKKDEDSFGSSGLGSR